jgi:hypothetical protein
MLGRQGVRARAVGPFKRLEYRDGLRETAGNDVACLADPETAQFQMDLHLLPAAARIAVMFQTAIVFVQELAARFERTVGEYREGPPAGDLLAEQLRAARADRKYRRLIASGR